MRPRRLVWPAMAETEASDRAAIAAALFGGPAIFAPIRHHSPACAWALRAMIREYRPDIVLIEAPYDLAHHIPHLLDPEARFPLAVVALGETSDSDAPRPVTYLPFSDHAPETIAIREATALGAEIAFIDLNVNARHLPAGRPVPAQPEAPFDQADFVTATCRTLGLRDGLELWDHLFETRLGQHDWRDYFIDVYAYCAALRDTTPGETLQSDGTLAREAQMRAHLARHAGRRAVVVTGGFHTPALIEAEDGASDEPNPTKLPPSESYLIGYGEEALDALSGYGAGLRFPGWYAALWARAEKAGGVPDWSANALETLHEFARSESAAGHAIPLPNQVEALALAKGLANLRGRHAIMLRDLTEAMRSATIKGEAHADDRRSIALRNHLRGFRLGAAPRAAGLPPIVHDARARARKARIDLTDSLRRPRKLDFRRKPGHAETAQFFHQMQILDTGFAGLVSGPDPVGGARSGLIFEEWEVAWSPQVEGRLIAAAQFGATVPEAAATQLLARRTALIDAGRADDLPALLDLMIRAVAAGLAQRMTTLLDDLAEIIPKAADLDKLADFIARAGTAGQPGAPLSGPGIPDFAELTRMAYARFLYLCDDLPEAPTEALDTHITALGRVASCLANPDFPALDTQRFHQALRRVGDAPKTLPLLRGAVFALMVRAAILPETVLADALRGSLITVGAGPEDRAAVLDGLLRSAPMLLWQSRDVLIAAESALAALDDDAFLDQLPVLRRSLTQLNPHETNRLADEVAELFGVGAAGLTAPSRFSEAEAARALRADRALRAQLDADGLSDWVPA
ncbi:MAG: hypothetical protein DI616_01260 [Paracoccus denitrificans]|uniref:Uncharacterized protein n=1 Tax=Paracoccus denitrificans TaxID=266 RepID=A0A533IFR3_PARDE|nr:MAG: hypothetical protein DI616_01260 [Paracoccus denitrificans]